MPRHERVYPAPPQPAGMQARSVPAEKAAWIALPGQRVDQPQAALFINRFRVDETVRVIAHVSADQRFRLELDGVVVGRGPHRGDLAHWAFSSYALDLDPGEHELRAEVVWAGENAAQAQLTWRPGFLFAVDGPLAERLDTGVGDWRVRALPAYGWTRGTGHFTGFTGAPLGYDGRQPPGPEVDPVVTREAVKDGFSYGERPPGWRLWPSPLPDLLDVPMGGGRVRAWASVPLEDGKTVVTDAMQHAPERAAWQALLDHASGASPVVVPAGQTVSVLVDWNDYYVALPGVVLDGADGGRAVLSWSEAFMDPASAPPVKGRRDVVEGKAYNGAQHDVFIHGADPERPGPRTYGGYAWRAGRYLVVTVTAPVDGDVRVAGLACRESRYPFGPEAEFAAPHSAIAEPVALMTRGLQCCMMETFVDCPHYEQLQYVGDSRITWLLTYALSSDSRLAQRAIELFEWSRGESGLCDERYPSRTPQVSTTYGLIWAAALRDFAWWRDDPAWVRARRPMLRSTVEGALALRTDDGLLGPLPGWSFVDWVPTWTHGMPPDGDAGSLVNLHLLMALRAAAGVEDATGDAGMAARWRAEADALAKIIVKVYWDDARGLVADDRAHTHFSEHAQCLALLENALPEDAAARAWEGLLTATDLARTTTYFSFYLFETFAKMGRGDLVLDHMDFWTGMAREGFKTPMEHPEPSRSDCHAWSSHPLFHYYATLAGVRPAAPGFSRVRVAPSPGPMSWLRATLPHPRGRVSVDLSFDDGKASGTIVLPDGVDGEFVFADRTRALVPGENRLD